MSREVDRRKLSPGDQLKRSRTPRAIHEGRAARIAKLNLSTAVTSRIASKPPEKGNYIQRALNYVQSAGISIGISSDEAEELVPDPNPQETSSGAVTVHMKQAYKGIGIFQIAQAVHFSPDGRIEDAQGDRLSISGDIDASPKISVEDAVLMAARQVAVPGEDELESRDQFGQPRHLARIDLEGFNPRALAAFATSPEKPTTLEKGPFEEEIKAKLTWFNLGDDLRLSWEVILTMPGYEGRYRVLVDAVTGDILYSRQILKSLECKGNVFRVDGGGERSLVDFPLDPGAYNLPDPDEPLPSDGPEFPAPWVDEGSTSGNNVLAHMGDSGPSVDGQVVEGKMIFDSEDAFGDLQNVINLFYFNNYMHDFFYLLGFRESSGNFQRDNFGIGGQQGDRVDARIYKEPLDGTAKMVTHSDGRVPLMLSGPISRDGRHTALDSSVIFHEFTHGVTERLVGGPNDDASLEEDQSWGLAEGWSDYISCTVNGTEVVGSWIKESPDGIRRFRYDSKFPDHFGSLGTGRYDELHLHAVGEICCATIMELNRRIGKDLALQLMVDSWKLLRSNPTFLDMRDSVLLALDHKRESERNPISQEAYEAAKDGIWSVFAWFGMGISARTNGPGLHEIDHSFEPPLNSQIAKPTHLEASPGMQIPDENEAGITSVLLADEPGAVARISVKIDIEHPNIGDLRVSLTGPDGKVAALYDGERGSMSNLQETYTSKHKQTLGTMVGSPAKGEWALKVADISGGDTGVLRSWSLDLNPED